MKHVLCYDIVFLKEGFGMFGLSMLLFFISIGALIIGLIKPDLVLSWKKDVSTHNRKNVLKYFLSAVVISFILMMIFVDSDEPVEEPKETAQVEKTQEEDEIVEEPEEDIEQQESEIIKEEKEEKIEEEKTEYGLDEWWEVEDQWRLKIDSVRFTDERNQFSDKEPEAVVVIKYSYENLGYEGRSQDLFMTPENVIDGEGKVVSTYPAGANVSPKTTPIGAMTEGAEKSYGLTSDEGDIRIHFEKYSNDRDKQKVVFVIPLPTE